MESDPRYENALIYTIKTDDGIYVGSTIDFKNRKRIHRHRVKNNSKTLLYQNINSVINKGVYKIELHKLFPCLNRTELQIEERNIYEELNANLNTYSPHTTRQEHRQKNNSHCKTRVMCECGIESSISHIARHRNTKRHHDTLKAKITDDLLGFLTCKPCENVVITNTNNSHTTPYPSSDEEDF